MDIPTAVDAIFLVATRGGEVIFNRFIKIDQDEDTRGELLDNYVKDLRDML